MADKSKTNAIYRLGSHLLLCGDTQRPEHVRRLMAGAKADLLLTDPPYGVDYHGAAGAIANDNLDGARFIGFLSQAFYVASFVLRPGAAFYIWYSHSQASNFLAAVRSVG